MYMHTYTHSHIRECMSRTPLQVQASEIGDGYLSVYYVYAHIYYESVCHALPCGCRRDGWGPGTSLSVRYVYAHIYTLYVYYESVCHALPCGCRCTRWGAGTSPSVHYIYAHIYTLCVYYESVCHALPCGCRCSRWGVGTSPSVHSSMMIQTGFSVMTPISFTM